MDIQPNITGKKAGADIGGVPLTITIKRAQELSGLSRPTINRAIWSGRLRTTHVGSRHLIYFDSFQEMLGLNQPAA
jgi:excisionase family DNA binding protein